MRDDFSLTTKDALAKRVGYRCSNPNCRKLTSGPQSNPEKYINIGVASHITAAASNGPRYDKALLPAERKSAVNGIWLCQSCAKLIDSDTTRYPVGILREWKRISEEAALVEVETLPTSRYKKNKDIELIRFYSQCLDRPAFQDAFLRESEEYSAFDKAIEDTITAINTGCLRSRDGAVLSKSRGKSFLENKFWREKMDIIINLLRAIRTRYRSTKNFNSYEELHQLGKWMDATRAQIIKIFNEICKDVGIPSLKSPRTYW